MKNSEKILKIASDRRKARAAAIVAPLRKKAAETPTLKAIGNEAGAWGNEQLGKVKDWGAKHPVYGGAAGGAVAGGVAGLLYEALRGRKEGERKDYLRAMLTHALIGAGGGALLGHYKPTFVSDGYKSLQS